MGEVLHGSAKTTHAIRAELQRSHASVAHLARKYGIKDGPIAILGFATASNDTGGWLSCRFR
ncbi:hypothetical protein GCM10011349_25910 [Novosphingobium indicum]|uniref:Uncharacterized protein n=1 Tax=Novosphingobium indicum TaxID=462949 RepID=A0ABQ2JS84_9SPHN|nr:hypothetical protein GCM10011349_25910 [Novosphingobium indicum]